MKTLLATILLCLSLVFVGCASMAKQAEDASASAQRILTALLPPDFTGDFHSHEKNAYFNYDIDAAGLRFNPDAGKWGFTYFEFTGQGHFPLFSGLSWNGEHNIRLGTKPAP